MPTFFTDKVSINSEVIGLFFINQHQQYSDAWNNGYNLVGEGSYLTEQELVENSVRPVYLLSGPFRILVVSVVLIKNKKSFVP